MICLQLILYNIFWILVFSIKSFCSTYHQALKSILYIFLKNFWYLEFVTFAPSLCGVSACVLALIFCFYCYLMILPTSACLILCYLNPLVSLFFSVLFAMPVLHLVLKVIFYFMYLNEAGNDSLHLFFQYNLSKHILLYFNHILYIIFF